MPCLFPIPGFKSRTLNKSGKRSVVFNVSEGYKDQPIDVPCGQCRWCRLERSRQWAVRCMHETQMHENNCFITLTYAPENLPENGTLVKKHYQDFMKRLREKFASPDRNDFGLQFDNIRYYMCGEYGDENDRPHYHAILFNFCFPDLYPWKMYRGNQYYRSPSLEALWPYGHSAVGEANFETAAYVARYILKKRLGPSASDHYSRLHPTSPGEIIELLPEYTDMSRRGGIGKAWLEKYSSDVYPHDMVIVREKKCRPPKYYDRLFEKEDSQMMRKIKNKRVEVAKNLKKEEAPWRALVKEKCLELKTEKLVRSYENGSQNVHDL